MYYKKEYSVNAVNIRYLKLFLNPIPTSLDFRKYKYKTGM